jgi:hypothetical protein
MDSLTVTLLWPGRFLARSAQQAFRLTLTALRWSRVRVPRRAHAYQSSI